MYRREYTLTRRLLALILILGGLISSVAISHKSANARIETSNNTLPGEQPASENIELSQRSLSFEVNQGQTDKRVGTAHVTGVTYSSNFPVVNGFQLASGGFGDAFVTTITPVKCE
jgi:hypothetical protein